MITLRLETTKRIFIGFLLLTQFAVFVPVYGFGQQMAHAFLIASPNPDDEAISKLPGLQGESVKFPRLKLQVDIDLGRMQKWLAASGFAKSQITVIDGNDLSVNRIKKEILAITPTLAKDALVLFYFTGHGVQVNDSKTGPDKEPDDLDEGLVLYNEIWVDDDINAFYKANMGRFRNVMIIDACYAGSTYKFFGGPTIRELSLKHSSKNLFDEKRAKLNYGNDICAPFFTDKSISDYAMLYFGAAGDTEQAKADNDGSWLTRSISLIVEDQDFINDGNYLTLNCALYNLAKGRSLNFQPVYVEIGNVESYHLTKPLK
ncbi:caspase family protein [Mucilaginibacter phyllosphaerae]